MSEDMNTGGNAAAALKGFIDEVTDLKNEEITAKESRKGLLKDLKEEKLPAAMMVALAKQDDKAAAAQIEELKKAGALMGKTVYTEALSAKDAKEITTTLGEEVQTYADAKIAAILATDADLEQIKSNIKAKLAAAKSEGFVPAVISLIADFRIDPEKRKKHDERDVVLDKYLTAVGMT